MKCWVRLSVALAVMGLRMLMHWNALLSFPAHFEAQPAASGLCGSVPRAPESLEDWLSGRTLVLGAHAVLFASFVAEAVDILQQACLRLKDKQSQERKGQSMALWEVYHSTLVFAGQVAAAAYPLLPLAIFATAVR